jgi:hypothetical protein
MGNSQSNNVANIVSNIMSSASSSILSNQSSQGTQNQIISVSGGTGTVNISDNVQSQNLSINMDGLAKAMSSQSIQQDIVQQLTQSATAVTSGINLFQNSKANNTLNDYLNVGLSIASNIGQLCTSTGNQNQAITVDTHNGNVVINDNTQTQMATVFAKCIQDATASNSAVQSVQQSMDQEATAKSQGLDLWQIIIMAIIGLLFISAPILVPLLGGASIIMKLLFPLCVIAGVFVGYWYWKEKSMNMSAFGFSTLISKDGDCGAVNYANFTTFATPDDAGTACEKDDKCEGLDWIPGSPPNTSFYSNLSSVPCPNVKSDTTGTTLITNAALIAQVLKPPQTTPSSSVGNNGDVFLDLTTGRMYWRLDDKWIDQGILPNFKTGSHILYGEKSPDATDGVADDLYIDTTDPYSWKLYQKTASSTSGSATPTAVWGVGVVLKSKTADDAQKQFPGQHPNAPQSNLIKWSAFKEYSRNPFYLYLAIGLVCLGIMGSLMAFGGSSSSSSSSSNSYQNEPTSPTSSILSSRSGGSTASTASTTSTTSTTSKE